MTVVIEPVYLQLFMLPITCFISPKLFFLVVTMFGEMNELHQHVALGTINLTNRCPMCIFYHAIYSHGVLPHRCACWSKCLTQIKLRWTPAFSAIHGLWLAEAACHWSLPRLVNAQWREETMWMIVEAWCDRDSKKKLKLEGNTLMSSLIHW